MQTRESFMAKQVGGLKLALSTDNMTPDDEMEMQ